MTTRLFLPTIAVPELQLTNLSDPDQLDKLNGFLRDVAATLSLRNHVIIGDIVTPTPAASFTVRHDLGRIPLGFGLIGADQACSVFTVNKSAWTSRLLYAQASVDGATISLVVF